ncbi:MAG: tetratricopeptide repeat protein [Planctomycetota bacterium]
MIFNLIATGALLVSAPQEAPALDAELLVGHPAYVDGDLAAVRADVLTALERTPDAPLAPLAAKMLAALELDGEWDASNAVEEERIARLADVVSDAEASLAVRRSIRRTALRRRFEPNPPSLPGDLFAEFVADWRVMAPLGPLDLVAPAVAGPPESSPELESGGLRPEIAETYRTSFGEERRWRRVTRERNQRTLDVTAYVHPGGGLTYALAFIDAPDAVDGGDAVLEVRTDGPVRAWWNGVLAFDAPRTMPDDTRERFLVRVPVAAGWNAVCLRVPTDASTAIAVRLLDERGRILEITEPDADAGLLVDWTPGGPVELLPSEMLVPEPFGVSPEDPFTPALRMYCALEQDRADHALAVPAPSDPVGLAAWRRLHLRALEEAEHLPDEIRRRRTIEVVEALERDGPFFASARSTRFSRLLGEDRPADALAVVDAWIGAAPDRVWPRYSRVWALDALDRRGTLGRLALEEIVADDPTHIGARVKLAQRLRGDGASARALAMATSTLTSHDSLGAGDNTELIDLVLALREPTGGSEALLASARAWSETVPGSSGARSVVRRFLEASGRIEDELAMAEEDARTNPGDPVQWWDVGNVRLELGDREGALEAFRRELALNPSDETTRELVERLGDPDPAEAFFARFAPDPEAAYARAEGAASASVVEVLDSGLVYFFPDGSLHARYHTLSRPTDRAGAEALHAIPIDEETLTIRVLARDGRVLEPVAVEGEWVLPALEPGDVVERVWDLRGESSPGTTPPMRQWSFASFERAFPTSRWVVYVPDGLRARFAPLQFEGTREETPVPGGTVYVFEDSNERYAYEPLQPSREEVVPSVAFGDDRDYDDELRGWRSFIGRMSAIPADIESEVVAFAAEHASIDRERTDGELLADARALYEALDQRIRDYEGERSAAYVWQQERGWPSYLLGALYERAGIPFEWGVLEKPVSPELDPEPVAPFSGTSPLTSDALRLSLSDENGDPVWIVYQPLPGTPFGSLASEMVGATVHVLEADGGTRVEALPRTQQRSVWTPDIRLAYAVAADGSAVVKGRFVDASPQGQAGARRLAEATSQQRETSARRLAAQIAQGVDVQSARFVLDGSEGEGVVVLLEGTHPSFVNEATAGYEARLPFTPLQLDRQFGPAERRWPLALRQAVRMRTTIELELDPVWEVVGGPSSSAEEREGFTVALDAEANSGVYVQRFEQRGLVLAPADVPPFLERMKELQLTFDQPLVLAKSGEDGR